MKNLRDARKDAGYTQKQLSELLGISQQSYSDYENSRTFPDLVTLIGLANALNVSVDYLVGRTDDYGAVIISGTPQLPEEELQLLALFRKMSKTQRVRFVAYGEGLLGVPTSAVKP